MGVQKYMVRVIRSGPVTESFSFPVGDRVKARSPRKYGNSKPRQQSANERSAVRRFARLINCNYKPGDLLLGLEYTDEALAKLFGGVDPEDLDTLRKIAEHECDKYLRRLKRELAKAGVELKYIAVTSDMDGDTGEVKRVHHHVLIPVKGITMQGGELYVGKRRLADIWGHGHVDYKPLSHRRDYTDLAAYLLRQVRRVPDHCKYKASRNMKKPVIVSEKIEYTKRELRVPKGATLLERGAYIPGEGQYIRYTTPERARKIGGKRE